MTSPETEIPTETTEPVAAPETEPNREAAKYRRQLRDTEGERDTLRQRVEAMQRAEITRIAGAEHHLSKPDAIWATGRQVAEFLDDAGEIDHRKVDAITAELTGQLGLATAPRTPLPDRSQGAQPMAAADTAPTWGDLLKR